MAIAHSTPKPLQVAAAVIGNALELDQRKLQVSSRDNLHKHQTAERGMIMDPIK